MERVSVLCLLLLLCSLSGAELQDFAGQRKASPEGVNVPEQPQSCPSDLHAVLRDMSVKLAENRLMIQQLQALNQELAAKLKEVDTLKLQQQEHGHKLKELQTSEVAPMKEQLRAQESELKSIKTQADETKEQVETLKRDKAVGQVAFSASLLASGSETFGPYNSHTNLVYKHVVSNIGNAYNPNTGVFTAPVRGAYHFEFYVSATGPPGSSVLLVKNGDNIVNAYEQQSGLFATAANGATLLLEVGDVVFLRLWKTHIIYDNTNHHSTFSGHLLFTM